MKPSAGRRVVASVSINPIMKTSRKLLLSLAGLALLAAPVVRADEPAAPPPDKPEHRRDHGGPGAMMDRAAKELGLSADQEAKWKEIGQQERTAIDPIRNDASLSKEDKRAKMMEVNKTYAEQRRALLNADQQKKFDEMRAKMREHGPRGPKKDKQDN